jgi:hypothetical protein
MGSCPILITGVGAVATTEALWHHLYAEGPPEVIIVLGLAGAYDRSLPLYAGVQVRKDVWAAFGRRRVRSLEPLPQSLLRDFPLVVESLAPMLAMPQVIGLTLESVSACRKEAALLEARLPQCRPGNPGECRLSAIWSPLGSSRLCPAGYFQLGRRPPLGPFSRL